jgi:hypothetical protein
MRYHFRVLIDYEKDVFREIAIRSDQTFMDLHHSIIKAFDFKGDQMASFYMSNDDWDKGEEIAQFDMGEDAETRSMENTLLSDLLKKKNQKVLYVYDFLRFWIFYIELISLSPVNEKENYPILLNGIGTAPDEESKSIDFEMPKGRIGEDDELDPELQDLLGGDDDDDESDYIDPNDISNYY